MYLYKHILPIISTKVFFLPRDMLSNISICIKGYKCRLLLNILCLSFWIDCPLENYAPCNLLPLGLSASSPYVWFFLSSNTFVIRNCLPQLHFLPENDSWIGCPRTHVEIYDTSFPPYSSTFFIFFFSLLISKNAFCFHYTSFWSDLGD